MKRLFNLLLVSASLLVISCEDVEPTIYNGETSDNTFLTFSSNVYTLPVVIDETGSVVITLNSSTVSDVDRVYNLEVIEEDSTADPQTYTLPSSITIPAGSYQGTATIEGVDGGLVETDGKPFVFRITNLSGEHMDTEEITVNVVEVCPLEDDFTGTYRFTQITEPLNAGFDLYLFEQNGLVEVEVGENEYERIFVTDVWPGFFDLPFEFRFNLSCGEIKVSEYTVETGCTWIDEEAGIILPFVVKAGPTTTPYNNEDDTQMTFIVISDARGTCIDAHEVIFTLTKVSE